MGRIGNKILYKFLIVIFILLFIVGLSGQLIEDEGFSNVVAQFMSGFPFAGLICEIIAKLFDSEVRPPLMDIVFDLNKELIKLFAISIIRPFIGKVISMVFLPMPSAITDWEERERYMNRSFSYRVKNMVFGQLLATVIAVIITGRLFMVYSGFISSLGNVAGGLINFTVNILLLVGAGLVLMFLSKLALGTAVAFQGVGVFETVLSTVIFVAAYFFIYAYGASPESFTALITLIIFLFIVQEFVVNSLRRVILK